MKEKEGYVARWGWIYWITKQVRELDWSAANLKTAQVKLVGLWQTITGKLKMAADLNPVTNVFQN